jgi:hypothetical protein
MAFLTPSMSPLLLQPALSTSVFPVSTLVGKRAVSIAPSRRSFAVIRMVDNAGEKTSGESPEGFALLSEQTNGCLALVGFALADATELIHPEYCGIVAQSPTCVKGITNL